MIFKILLWYALLSGAKKGLKGELPPRRTTQKIDTILMDLYLKPIIEQLNLPFDDAWIFKQEESSVDPGSML